MLYVHTYVRVHSLVDIIFPDHWIVPFARLENVIKKSLAVEDCAICLPVMARVVYHDSDMKMISDMKVDL